jgi:ClpP class serine protease
MAHKLPRLSQTLLETPQYITQSKFDEIVSILEDREHLTKLEIQAESIADSIGTVKSSIEVEDSVGVLRVEGATTYKPNLMQMLCGGCSYTQLLEDFSAMVKLKNPPTHVLMLVDSHGGQAYRCRSSMLQLRKLADENNIRLIGYCDGVAASAGYYLMAACHELVANPAASIGSIGCVVKLVSNEKQLISEGQERKYITYGASKVPFDASGSFTEGYLADIQESVDRMGSEFVQTIADIRGLTFEQVHSTDARMFSAEKAMELGLIDKVMEAEDFYEYLAELNDSTINKTSLTKNTILPLQKDTKSMSAELQVDPAEFAKMQAQMDQQAALLAAYQAKETQLAKETLSAQLDNSPFLAECKETLLNFFMSADVSDTHKELMNTVIGAANASNESVLADAVAQVTEAQSKVEAAEAEVESVKTEFATSVQSVQLEVKEQVQGSNVLAEKIAKLKAAQAK